MRATNIRNDERGFALVMALMILLAMSMLAVVLMITVTVERKIAGHSMRKQQALELAEAGVSEVCARLSGDMQFDATATPRTVKQVFLAPAGSVPALGTDSVGYRTLQPAGQWLTYSTAARGPDALTVEYKTDGSKSVIYKYDATKNPPVQTLSGLPIYRVTATGIKGTARARVVAEVTQKPFNALVQAAMMADVPVNMSGNAAVCGYNHRADTPTYTELRLLPNTNGAGCDDWETNSGDLPALWSTKAINTCCSSNPTGWPVTSSPGNPTFFNGPWDPLNMTQADFWAWVGTRYPSAPSNPTGIIYVDNNGIAQDGSADIAYQGGDGRGFLYIDGDLSVNGNFSYRGLVYVEGDLKINGTCWILGALIVKGKTTINIANGSFTVLYSSDAITQNITQSGSQYITLSWREVFP